jgi:hypothetical protein
MGMLKVHQRKGVGQGADLSANTVNKHWKGKKIRVGG